VPSETVLVGRSGHGGRKTAVRPLSPHEALTLWKLARLAPSQAARRDAISVIASATRMGLEEIAVVVRADRARVATAIERFNAAGLASLPFVGPRVRRRWSLAALRQQAVMDAVVGVPKERPPADRGPKAERILRLYGDPPEGGRVLCCGELRLMGPHSGVRGPFAYLFAALDVSSRRLQLDFRRRRDATELMSFLAATRASYDSRKRLHLIQDPSHWRWVPSLRRWAERDNVELVPTSVGVAHLNRIWCHVWAFQEFALRQAAPEACGDSGPTEWLRAAPPTSGAADRRMDPVAA
jgi:hypothetical protein